jgi:hypothetical protein
MVEKAVRGGLEIGCPPVVFVQNIQNIDVSFGPRALECTGVAGGNDLIVVARWREKQQQIPAGWQQKTEAGWANWK